MRRCAQPQKLVSFQIRREGKIAAIADLSAFLRRADDSANPYVYDGDVIFVPRMGSVVVSVIMNEVVVSSQSGVVTENSMPYAIKLRKAKGGQS